MLRKPPGCVGCPFYGDGKGFVPDELRERAPVFVLGQNPGADEEHDGKPFTGKTGQEMERRYFPKAGLTREQTSIGNVIRCRLNHQNALPEIKETVVHDAITHCTRAHYRVPSGAKLIVSQGDYAALGATGDPSSTTWRGWLVPSLGSEAAVRGLHLSEPWVPVPGDLPVLVTVHLARLYRDSSLKLATQADWGKVARFLRGTWPRRPPAFYYGPIEDWGKLPPAWSFDTEYVVEVDGRPGDLVRYSQSWGLGDRMTAVVEADEHIVPVLALRSPRVITQYAPADVRHLARLSNTGKSVWDVFTIDDTVWKHAVLYSDMPHDLDFLGSLYASINRWKHLGDTVPELYAGCDSLGTLEVDQALEREFNRDPVSRRVYEELDRPVIRHYVERQYKGLRVWPERVAQVAALLEKDKSDAQGQATAATGWPINLGSTDQVGHRLFLVDGLKAPRGVGKRRRKSED